jgi:hypothetical protein
MHLVRLFVDALTVADNHCVNVEDVWHTVVYCVGSLSSRLPSILVTLPANQHVL